MAATLVPDERRAAKAAMLDAYPDLKAMYSADDDNTEVFYLHKIEQHLPKPIEYNHLT